MNIAYKFSEKSHEELLKFMKLAEQNKFNKFCNLNTHDKLGEFIQTDPLVEEKLRNYVPEADNCVNIISSDEETDSIRNDSKTNQDDNNMLLQEISSILNETETTKGNEDLPAAIKESLQFEKTVPQNILTNLENCTDNQIRTVISSLESLRSEEIMHFGRNVLELNPKKDSPVLINYFSLLLLKTIRTNYCEYLQQLLGDFCSKYDNLIHELSIDLLEANNTNPDILMQYVNSLPVSSKLTLMRDFIENCSKLEAGHLTIVENLLNEQLEYETLKKLVELMSNSADEFSNDKSFGKVLFNVLNILGSNVQGLEQPLKHLIGRHSSIWKPKVQNVYFKSLEELSFLTQSLRH